MAIRLYKPQSTGDYITVVDLTSNTVVLTDKITQVSGEVNELHGSVMYISGRTPFEGRMSNIPGGYTESFQTTSYTGNAARLYLDTYNNNDTFGSSFRGRRFRGTPSNPSGILRNDVILHLAGDAYNKTNVISNSATMLFAASEDWETNRNGTYFRLRLTPSGQTGLADRLWIKDNGNVGISNTNPQYTLEVSGVANFTQGIYLNNSPIQSLLTGATVSPQNSEIYRNQNNQITGIKYDNDFSRIYRNQNNKITGIYYNNYFKKILYDGGDKVTGVNIVYY